MIPTGKGALLMVFLLTFSACSTNRRAPEVTLNNQTAGNNSSQNNQSGQTTKLPQPTSALRVGEASGSYTCEGETMELKYAYAGRAKRFGHDYESIVLFVTDKPIPVEAVAEEIESRRMLYDHKVRGLEYVIEPDRDFYWVSFHPDQYQESVTGSPLKEFAVEQETITGRDENDGHRSEGRYKTSVRFRATIVK